MTILFLYGWNSMLGGVKPTYLKDHGHEVINPALPHEDFAEAVRIAQAEFDAHKPQVIVGSSRGGAIAMNMNSGDAKLVLLCRSTGRRGATGSLADKMAGENQFRTGPATDAVNPWNVKENNPLTTAVNGLHDERAKGLEPSTSSLGSRKHRDASEAGKELTASTSHACTAACTKKPETAHETPGEGTGDQATNDAEPITGEGADTLAMLAAALVGLSAADRAKLAAMLLQGNDSKADASTRKTSTGKRGTRNKKG